MIRHAALVLALAAALAPGLASAKNSKSRVSQSRDIEVRFKDLDFSRASDVAQFRLRMKAAADALCARTAADDARTLRTRGEIRARCEAVVRAEVEAQLPQARREQLAAAAPALRVEMAGR
jgi:UrcA family protein